MRLTLEVFTLCTLSMLLSWTSVSWPWCTVSESPYFTLSQFTQWRFSTYLKRPCFTTPTDNHQFTTNAYLIWSLACLWKLPYLVFSSATGCWAQDKSSRTTILHHENSEMMFLKANILCNQSSRLQDGKVQHGQFCWWHLYLSCSSLSTNLWTPSSTKCSLAGKSEITIQMRRLETTGNLCKLKTYTGATTRNESSESFSSRSITNSSLCWILKAGINFR